MYAQRNAISFYIKKINNYEKTKIFLNTFKIKILISISPVISGNYYIIGLRAWLISRGMTLSKNG